MNIIFLFGASCSGKSTLGMALQRSLGNRWTYIDRDVLIEQGICSESKANDVLDEKIKVIKNNIIIDAQIPWREKRTGELYFLVTSPLKTLLDRDSERTKYLQLPHKIALQNKEYVIKTAHALNEIEKTKFDRSFDSSQLSVQYEVNTIKTFIYKPNMQSKKVYVMLVGLTISWICVLILFSKRLPDPNS